jgi:hypothetical protein
MKTMTSVNDVVNSCLRHVALLAVVQSFSQYSSSAPFKQSLCPSQINSLLMNFLSLQSKKISSDVSGNSKGRKIFVLSTMKKKVAQRNRKTIRSFMFIRRKLGEN